jgi:tRNA threonylcarbamoyladenosine biosynthesis protein TsaE
MKIKYNLKELPKITTEIIKTVDHKTLLFYGDMGVGKTTLIKELVKQLGSDDVVSSPTFSLINEYHSRKGEQIFHFDFYRIEHEDEALDIGIEDYFYDNVWCFIEWPENIKNLLPLNAVEIYLSLNDDGTRSIEIKQ